MPKRSKFNLGSYKLLTADMGYLIPIQIKDVICGDIFKGGSQAFIRMQPMLAPIMHPIHVRIHHFFVPYRLIWDDFEEFITKNDETLFVPQIEFTENKSGSLADYIGVPPLAKDAGKTISVSALPFRAYNLIWNNFYRDQDLQSELPISFESGTDDVTPVDLRSVCWQKDYFTLARPWEQKGEEVNIPIYATSGQTSDVYTGISATFKPVTDLSVTLSKSGTVLLSVESCKITSISYISDTRVSVSVDCRCRTRISAQMGETSVNTSGSFQADIVKVSDLPHSSTSYVLKHSLSVDSFSKGTDWSVVLSISEGLISVLPSGVKQVGLSGYLSISDIRQGIAEQRLRERKAKWGSEYRDLLASYGIGYSDARLQLPEYVAGGSSLLRISEVIQTAPSETLGVVGDMKGYGLGLAKSNMFKHRFVEHGIFMSLMSVLPQTMYADGMERYLLKKTADDFYQREIASLVPMQEIWKQELFSTANPDEVFGYIDRYDELRHGYSTIAGDFRNTLDYWHMARRFDSVPVLNGDFVRSSPTKRIFAEQTQHELLIMAQNMCRARRILPKHSKTGAL